MILYFNENPVFFVKGQRRQDFSMGKYGKAEKYDGGPSKGLL